MPPKKPGPIDYGNFGIHGGKHDLERWGVFAEMMYLHGLGMTAVPLYPVKDKGRQMFPGFPKWKTELQDCYFDHEFKRIFIGEALNSVYKRDAKARLEGKEKFRTPAGITPQPTSKQHSTPGDFYGTFGGIVPAFDPRKRKVEGDKDKKESKRPISTKPGKKGGIGVADITINKFPEWKAEKYDRKMEKKEVATGNRGPFRGGGPGSFFDSNPYLTPNPTPTYKKQREISWIRFGTFFPPKASMKLDGMKGGCLSKYPAHSADKYFTPAQIEKMRGKDKEKPTGKFIPCGAGKTWPLPSVVNTNVDFRTNAQNYKTMKPYTYTREFLHDIEF
ncbi:hypothetical protein GE061_019233 [Apolygus lucorum]|uniref:Cilia-and flagella-associated protein 96 n=1 Tax=Apolygus lucorum TaxID=248454 RepID=A0A6A4J7B0_APOLU|nr:hypothetical protein GE061_019233 [Apolygus lucorum]